MPQIAPAEAQLAEGVATPDSAALRESYPMYVLPVSAFMQMAEWRPHQDLLKEGVIVEWTPSMHGRTFFVSHQWTSFNHPDPTNDQLQTLQAVLGRLERGELAIKANWVVHFLYRVKQLHTSAEWQAIMRGAYLWYDFTSMPQPAAAGPNAAGAQAGPAGAHAGMVSTHSDHRVCSEDDGEEVSRLIAQLKAAVDSIPSYMERCDEMLVLVPSVRHQDREGEVCDYNSWRQRGWCRLEFVSSRLCSKDVPVIVIDSKEAPPEYFNLCDTTKLFAGQGSFTVEDDKAKVAAVLAALVASKAKGELALGNYGLFRAHLALANQFLMDLPEVAAQEAAHGTTHGATHAPPGGGGTAAVARLKRELCWRDATTEATFVRRTGLSLLHIAAARCDIEAVHVLLGTPIEARHLNAAAGVVTALDPRVTKGQGSALLVACVEGQVPLSLALCTTACNPMHHSLQSHAMQVPLGLAILANHPRSAEVIALLLGAGADPSKGPCPAFILAAGFGSVEVMEVLLRLCPSIDVNAAAPLSLRSPVMTGQFMRATALHLVCRTGDASNMRAKVECLLKHGAAPSLKKGDIMGGSPLCSLSRNPEADRSCVGLLIEHGASLTSQEKAPLPVRALLKAGHMLASHTKAFAILKEPCAMHGGGSPMHFAALRGDVGMLKELALHGVPVDVRHQTTGKLPSQIFAATNHGSQALEVLEGLLLSPEQVADRKAQGADRCPSSEIR